MATCTANYYNETCELVASCEPEPGRYLCPVCWQLEADARALWAVRVLDAWADQPSARWQMKHYYDSRLRTGVFYLCHRSRAEDQFEAEHRGESADAARLAAAEAVFPELPADVRAKLGERP
jgi:hypothetical protein